MLLNPRKLRGIQFGFYTQEQVLSLSNVEIKSMLAFDELKNPIVNGLYDSRMGVGPYNRFGKCPTCHKGEKTCQGHFGHIRLILPIYNLFLMRSLEKLLRIKCFSCHRILLNQMKVKEFGDLFRLLQFGKIPEFVKLEELCQLRMVGSSSRKAKKPNAKKDSFHSQGTEDQTRRSERSRDKSESGVQDSKSLLTEGAESEDRGGDCLIKEEDDDVEKIDLGELLSRTKDKPELKEFHTKLLEGLITKFKAKKTALRNSFQTTAEPISLPTSFRNKLCRTLQKELFKEASKLSQCPYCKYPRATVRKEGNLRFNVCRVADKVQEEPSGLLDTAKAVKSAKQTKILSPVEVKEHMQNMYLQNKKLLDWAFGKMVQPGEENNHSDKLQKIGFQVDEFFLEVLAVSPNRFRPDNKLGDQIFLHSHTTFYTKVLSINQEIKVLMMKKSTKSGNEEDSKALFETMQTMGKKKEKKRGGKEAEKKSILVNIFSKWLELQETVNSLFDSSQSGKMQDKEGGGIKQLLEKKEGLFRMKMMGKRVNFSGRSVISPDPNLDTREIGVPMFMAKKLMFPERVTATNVEDLRVLVINGPKNYPGAHFIEENGRRILLERATLMQRQAFARQLLDNAENKVVYRQLLTGDALLFNRQPTLHKNSMTVHQARVLSQGLTIRFHYANCNGYNADFDGDEMNLHFLQNHQARAEALHLALNDKQFILSTNQDPIRGLVQDYVFCPMLLSLKNVFLRRNEFFQLLYIGLFSLVDKSGKRGLLGLNSLHRNNVESSNYGSEFWFRTIKVIHPAVVFPEELWTGKQLFSNIIKLVAEFGQEEEAEERDLASRGIVMKKKTRTNESYLCAVSKEDSQMIVRKNIIMTGIIDKNAVGTSKFGFIHCFYEIYGPHKTGILMSAITKMCTNFLKLNGYTCGLGDLALNQDFERKRGRIMGDLHYNAIKAMSNLTKKEIPEEHLKNKEKLFTHTQASAKYQQVTLPLRRALAHKILSETKGLDEVDMEIRSAIAPLQSELYNCMYDGLQCKFPDNKFSGMVLPGAKGSILNHNQVSSNLGQQSLEGQRVPLMASGKSLPCFLPYDPNPRAGGFIGDRFLSGLRPAEFYFHCMAGREGLVDTAIKTSRSGYLQRMLIKNLEALVIGYDYTVRDICDQSLVQFNYGEDGLDSMKVNPLQNMEFLLDNFENYQDSIDIQTIKKSVDTKSAYKLKKQLIKSNQEVDGVKVPTIQEQFPAETNLGSTPYKRNKELTEFIAKNKELMEQKDISPRNFEIIHDVLYLKSLACPGDSVGAIAGQSFGEPSTQMTLNTFHLAGHGGANVTLGIPRLRELLSTKNMKKPMMMLPFNPSLTPEKVHKFFRSVQKVTLLQLVKAIELEEELVCLNSSENSMNSVGVSGKTIRSTDMRYKKLVVRLEYEDEQAMKECFDINYQKINDLVGSRFVNLFNKVLRKLMKGIKSKNARNKNMMKSLMDDIDKEEAVETKAGKETSHLDEEIKLADEDEDDLDDNESLKDLVPGAQKIKEEVVDIPEIEGDLIANIKPLKEAPKKKILLNSDGDNSLLKETTFNRNQLDLVFHLPLNIKRTLFIPIVQQLLEKVSIREISGIKKLHLIEGTGKTSGEFTLQTEGLNYSFAWSQPDIFNVNRIESNDVQEVAKKFGIEAGRNCLALEVNKVFSHYGIAVDFRHMSLVADHMSFSGELRPLSRMGMQHAQSPLLKMSFETSMNFLIKACENKDFDNLNTASGNIVVGELMKNGTGAFDVIDCRS